VLEVKGLKFDKKNEVGWIILDNPPVNVINISMMLRMRDALGEFKVDPDVKVVAVRSGIERCFSAGVDVSQHGPTFDLFGTLAAVHGAIRRVDKPCVFVVGGYCLGGAFELLMDGDMAIASDRASFGQPEIKWGQLAIGAVHQVPSRAGKARAMELLLTGDRITAQEALQWGLINKVVPHDSLMEEADTFIKRVTVQSGKLLSITRRAITLAYEVGPDIGKKAADEAWDAVLKTEDYREGIRAFREKRAAQWKNR